MKQQAKWVGRVGVCLLTATLAGCAGQSAPSSIPESAQQTPLSVEPQAATGIQPSPVGRPSATDWVPPLFASPEEKAAYYVSRLADRRFVSSYGGSDNPRIWYIAAERLGQIGMPAVPLLFARLNTHDDYELMLALYALQLATQDPLLTVQTRGDYIQLNTVLDPGANAENLRLAQEWWQQHSALLN
ncbi:hypothetical protein [Vreelandella olivaria]|uniref:hypothetical protein n=1 Tax=Vreelandella olivaria TaxID=390919 RepID=UPI00201F9E3D|nr:hypothetical protein [Halomonas olivaria]